MRKFTKAEMKAMMHQWMSEIAKRPRPNSKGTEKRREICRKAAQVSLAVRKAKAAARKEIAKS